MSPKSGPKRLRELLKQPGIIRSLGAHDVFTALIVEQADFETVFVGGFGTSARGRTPVAWTSWLRRR
jgi:2-methylisocitrate lyase-like PEP mutase family enzyme